MLSVKQAWLPSICQQTCCFSELLPPVFPHQRVIKGPRYSEGRPFNQRVKKSTLAWPLSLIPAAAAKNPSLRPRAGDGWHLLTRFAGRDALLAIGLSLGVPHTDELGSWEVFKRGQRTKTLIWLCLGWRKKRGVFGRGRGGEMCGGAKASNSDSII